MDQAVAIRGSGMDMAGTQSETALRHAEIVAAMSTAETPLTHDELVSFMRSYLDMIENEWGGLASNIEEGSCGDNADYTWNQTGRRVEVMDLGGFAKEDYSDWDYDILAQWPSVQPPPGLSWEYLAKGGWPRQAHVWVTLGQRHYDVEAVEGVDNPFDLHDIRRGLVRTLRRKDPELLERLSHDPWWEESIRLQDTPIAEYSGPSCP